MSWFYANLTSISPTLWRISWKERESYANSQDSVLRYTWATRVKEWMIYINETAHSWNLIERNDVMCYIMSIRTLVSKLTLGNNNDLLVVSRLRWCSCYAIFLRPLYVWTLILEEVWHYIISHIKRRCLEIWNSMNIYWRIFARAKWQDIRMQRKRLFLFTNLIYG